MDAGQYSSGNSQSHLTVDCLNSLNNTLSGGIFLGWGRTGSAGTPATSPCIANAWIGQFTVQTVDTTILIISITVLSIVMNSSTPSKPPSLTKAILICVAAWIPGLITSMSAMPPLDTQIPNLRYELGSVGLGLGVYGQVSGNWCWIKPQYLGLRYGLTHGWRIAVFVATIVIYTFVYLRLKSIFNRFRMRNSITSSNISRPQRKAADSDTSQIPGGTRDTELCYQPRHSSIDAFPQPTRAKITTDDTEARVSHRHSSSAFHTMGGGLRATASPNLKRMLLMNGYPIAYIVLWIPGMVNRLAESVGASPRWLQVLQASTQFVGLVNALTYGLNEQFRQRARERWSRHKFIRTGP